MMRRIFLSILCALPFVAILPASAQQPLVVGMELSYPPFEMTDAKGEPDGVSVVLAKALGEHLGRPVEIRNIPFDGLITSLRTGKVDLVISSMTATDERRKAIDFSNAYLKTGLCILAGKNVPVEGIEDLNKADRTVAVKKGTTGHLYATEHLKDAKVRVLDKENTCVLEVAQGRADAFLFDQMSTYQNWKKNEETTKALLKPFREESWAVGIRKGNDPLLKQVNEFLDAYKAKGGFDQLGDRFLKDQKDAFAKLGIPFYF